MTHIIMYAARMVNIEVLKELIRQPADLNVRDEKGYTPLIIACYKNHYQATQLLLEAGANVNAQDHCGYTALMGVTFRGYLRIAKLLISHGANLNAKHGNGGTALIFAAMYGRNDFLRLLAAKKELTKKEDDIHLSHSIEAAEKLHQTKGNQPNILPSKPSLLKK